MLPMVKRATPKPDIAHFFPLIKKGNHEGKKRLGYLEEIAPDFHLLHAPLEGHIPFAHSILLTGKRNILIDTGLGPETVQWLRKKFEISLVLNSHYHRDHNWCNYLFKGVPIRAHEQDAPAMNSMSVYFGMMGIIGRKDERLIRRETVKFIPHIQGPKVGTFGDGDVFDTGSVELKVVHLPGHSPGHCGFHEPKSNIVFCADICCDSFGPWYGHDCCSMVDFELSIDRLIEMCPSMLVTAHTPPIRANIDRALKDYRAKIEVRNLRLLEFLREPMTFRQLLSRRPLYSHIVGELKLPFSFWEEVMLRKHLVRLTGEKRVRKKGRLYCPE
jgi:glyoxylase-like metal-dependent hydrolase (beta-lactamase superfamily II)